MRAILLGILLLVPLAARADAADPGVPMLPEGPAMMQQQTAPSSGGAFSRFSRLNLGLSWFAWSAGAGLATTGWAVGTKAPSDTRLQTLALTIPVGTFYTPVFVGALWDGACGDGLDSPAARWRDAGGYGTVLFGVSWAVRALVAGALQRNDAAWPAYVGAVAGSAVEAVGVALLAGH